MFINLVNEFFLPKVLLPIYEKNLYQYLRQPLDLVKYDVDNQALDTEVAYLYYKRDGMMVVSENFEDVVPISPKEVIDKTNDDGYGKLGWGQIIHSVFNGVSSGKMINTIRYVLPWHVKIVYTVIIRVKIGI